MAGGDKSPSQPFFGMSRNIPPKVSLGGALRRRLGGDGLLYMVNKTSSFYVLILFDNQKEGKQSYFSLELLEEEISYRITHTHKKNQR